MIHHGDCLDVMAGMVPESVDAIVTDPPYDLTSTGARNGSPRVPGSGPYSRGFMGKAWDGTGIAFDSATWAAVYRLAKPSTYLLAFGGTRTVHRMAVAIEDAGWLIRDMLVWAYASGFPKSKASLKPAWEPIVMARKPGPLRDLAIDECRIAYVNAADAERREFAAPARKPGGVTSLQPQPQPQPHEDGRWPANVILTDPIFDGDTEGVVGGGYQESTPFVGAWAPRGAFPIDNPNPTVYGDSGTYSRFFLIPKADRTDREPVLRTDRGVGAPRDGKRETLARRNVHPTVKPTDLMRHLVRLVTPQGGTVLDPFLGSGTTGIAAELEGFSWIGIEKEAEYVQIAEARLNGTQRGMGLSA